MEEANEATESILRLLAPDEQLHAVARAADHRILITDRRIAVAEDTRVTLNIPVENLRRIQFDIEKSRPATLVLVPESPRDPPQVLAVPVEHYDEVALALARLGRLIAEAPTP